MANINILINVPKDGNCLFWAVMVSYLEQVKINQEEFKNRYTSLFGSEIGWERIFNFDDFNFSDKENEKLVKIFRDRICDYIETNLNTKRPNNKANFRSALLDSEIANKFFNKEGKKEIKEENQIKIILEKMRKNGTWGGSIEIEAMTNLLNCKINRNGEIFEPDNKISNLIEIKLNFENQHYQYISNLSSFEKNKNLIDNQTSLNIINNLASYQNEFNYHNFSYLPSYQNEFNYQNFSYLPSYQNEFNYQNFSYLPNYKNYDDQKKKINELKRKINQLKKENSNSEKEITRIRKICDDLELENHDLWHENKKLKKNDNKKYFLEDNLIKIKVNNIFSTLDSNSEKEITQYNKICDDLELENHDLWHENKKIKKNDNNTNSFFSFSIEKILQKEPNNKENRLSEQSTSPISNFSSFSKTTINTNVSSIGTISCWNNNKENRLSEQSTSPISNFS
ncbi:OTU domain-containing protein [Spiroplasma endosymbiont of Colias croceus]|uniref:OTU domain-containing protein n=1 Tax=Spiroplasma endosymbiont of Colias croceus TaxID=3066310 RepID=UPI0030D1CC65